MKPPASDENPSSKRVRSFRTQSPSAVTKSPSFPIWKLGSELAASSPPSPRAWRCSSRRSRIRRSSAPCCRTVCVAIEAPAAEVGPAGPDAAQSDSRLPRLGPASPSQELSRACTTASLNLWACASERGSISTNAATAAPARRAQILLPNPPRALGLIPYPPRPLLAQTGPKLNLYCETGHRPRAGPPKPRSVAGADEEEVAGLVAGELDGRVLGHLLDVGPLGRRRHADLEEAEHLLAGQHADIGPEQLDEGLGEGRVRAARRVEHGLHAARGHDHARALVRHELDHLETLLLARSRLEPAQRRARARARVAGGGDH